MYHLASLGPESSLKRSNGSGQLEWKAREGVPEPCVVSGVPAWMERWVKRRVRERDLDAPLRGAWIEVDKQLWRVGGVEICRLGIGARPWWTVAIAPGRTGKPAHRVLESWVPLLRSIGEATSYPVWVLARSSEHDEHPALADRRKH